MEKQEVDATNYNKNVESIKNIVGVDQKFLFDIISKTDYSKVFMRMMVETIKLNHIFTTNNFDEFIKYTQEIKTKFE